MKKLLIASTLITLAGGIPAHAADWPVKTQPVAAFAWTGCYAGGHVGGGWASKDVTDPVQLVQDAFLGLGTTVGVTTVTTNPSGYLIGGQFGCDYQFAGNVVIGVEGAISGGNLKDTVSTALPLGNPGDSVQITAHTDFISSATLRLGYSFDRLLLYVKGGGAWVSDKYSAVGMFQFVGFDFEGLDWRGGWTAGAGAEWALWRNWSIKLEYDYYDLGHRSVLMSDSVNVLSGTVDVKQTVQTVKLGLNLRVWWSDD
jgi:opacity protein-like surface antigen